MMDWGWGDMGLSAMAKDGMRMRVRVEDGRVAILPKH